MKLIVGLGNPGYEYSFTRHNLGFLAIDQLAGICRAGLDRHEAQAITAAAELEGVPVVLAKPQTFMNLSGLSVVRLVEKYRIAAEDLPNDLMVLLDEVNLPLGSIRIRPRGSAGGHNGLKSVIGALQSDEFVRIRMGVQPNSSGGRAGDLKSYVLGQFRKDELEAVSEMIERSVEAVRMILTEGVEKAMNSFNRRAESSDEK